MFPNKKILSLLVCVTLSISSMLAMEKDEQSEYENDQNAVRQNTGFLGLANELRLKILLDVFEDIDVQMENQNVELVREKARKELFKKLANILLVCEDFAALKVYLEDKINRIVKLAIQNALDKKLRETLVIKGESEDIINLLIAGANPNITIFITRVSLQNKGIHSRSYQVQHANVPVLSFILCNEKWRDNINLLNIILLLGADVNSKDESARTVLMYASEYSANIECFRALINAGADIEAKDNFKKTALALAILRGLPEDILELLKTKNLTL